jgi:hypothetical protein
LLAGKAAGEEKGWPNQHKKLRGQDFTQRKTPSPIRKNGTGRRPSTCLRGTSK